MLPVTTRPPRRPGGFGSPFGKPTEIALSKHPPHEPHPDPHKASRVFPPGHGQYVVPKGTWIIKCGPTNATWLTYKILVDEDGKQLDGEDSPFNPWNVPRSRAGYPPPDWSRNQPPPNATNSIKREELIKPGTTGTVPADGQNVTIEGTGMVTVIQVFSG
jgi:hypothetical protein